MTNSNQILADLDGILADWDDTITIDAVIYPGLFDNEYIESLNMHGYTPVFTGRAADLQNVQRSKAVTINSPLNGMTNVAFTVAVNQGSRAGVVTLILERKL